jgi:uncharacterized membrane protein (UPF0127 family)
MKRLWFSPALILIAGIIFQGCTKSAPIAPPAAAATAAFPGLPTKAQPRLQTIKLWIGEQEMVTELALTQEQEMTGMMFRTNMGPNEGMLFVFPEPTQASFWMMNTYLPLSAAYVSPDGVIQELHDFKPLDTNAVIAATANILYVLEAPKDWFKTNNIKPGTVITSESGPLSKIFVRR